MNKKILLTILVIVLVAVAAFGTYALVKDEEASSVFDPLNATYSIEGQSVTLVNGKAETPAAPGSVSQVTTTVFGEPATGDLNGDGKSDAALILVQDSGGSGTFYYAAAAINTPNGAEGTNAVLLGDRIAPQNVQIQNGGIIANYADRKPNDPMTAQPSVGVSKYFIVSGTTLTPSVSVVGSGEHCGGNMTTAATCAAGYHCAPVPGSRLPFGDVGGTCVAD